MKSKINSPIDLIVIHCSDSPHRGDGAATVHLWHLSNGWDGIGYHYVIQESGTIQAGRPEYWEGAHVRHYNENTLGIMLFGINYFTDEQFASLRDLLLTLRTRHPHARILGHRDLDDNKTCPNFDVASWCKKQGIDPCPRSN